VPRRRRDSSFLFRRSDTYHKVFDALIANPGRLRILAALANEPAEFVPLRLSTGLTDGNLATHARRLESAGLVAIDKRFRADGKPVTTLSLTSSGRDALQRHVQALINAVQPQTSSQIDTPRRAVLPDIQAQPVALADDADEWVD
jgi:DNA-binding MarR family transcriptional regulator